MQEAIAVFVAAAATWFDVRERRVPNCLTCPAMALGLVLWVAVGGLPGLAKGVFGWLVGLGSLFLPYLLLGPGIGEGDIKLMAALGAIGGARFALRCALGAAILGGLAAAWLMWRKGCFGTGVTSLAIWTMSAIGGGRTRAPLESRIALPYAGFILGGAIWACLVGGGFGL